jgi:hypothetical protein
MKSATITIVLGTALFLAAGVQAKCMLATENPAVQTRDNKTDESQTERNRVKQTGDGLSSKESNTLNKGKPSPTKKPRLKYRDEPGCSC